MFVSILRFAFVTRGNKGIGLKMCRQLASNDIKVILTTRNEIRRIETIEKLKVSGPQNAVFHQLQFKKLDILVRFLLQYNLRN